MKLSYGDWRASEPSPSYGYYEDEQRRCVFQWIEFAGAPWRFVIGRTDLDVVPRPPTMAEEEYAERFERYPRQTHGFSRDLGNVIARRLLDTLPYFPWPHANVKPIAEMDVRGEIEPAFDRDVAGVYS